MITHSTCIHKNLKFGGLNTGWSPTLILPQGKRPPQIVHWKGIDIYKVALQLTGSWGSWGSEVPKSTPTPHLPDELNPLLVLPPLLHFPK